MYSDDLQAVNFTMLAVYMYVHMHMQTWYYVTPLCIQCRDDVRLSHIIDIRDHHVVSGPE